jgi:lipoprotein-anchoring transpeptidase ErfK/SrfK
MVVRGMVLAGAIAAGIGAGPALAQGAAPGAYGGGFIEFLMTGQDPGAVARPRRPAPVAPDGTILAGRGYRQAAYASPAPDAPPAGYAAGDPSAYASPRGYARTAGYVPAYSGAQVGYAAVAPGPLLHSGDAVPQAYAPDPLEAPRTRRAALPEAREEGIARAVDPRFQRQEVAYDGGQRPGTVVIDTPSRFLYLVQPGGRALRYGIGVGRPGFTWSGLKTVSAKREWPDWTPPPEMLRRRPDLPRHMAGGPSNPLGARALYLGSSLYRIHGTNEPHTIGQSVSSGCIRMMNEDVMDLYERVPVGARVMVI